MTLYNYDTPIGTYFCSIYLSKICIPLEIIDFFKSNFPLRLLLLLHVYVRENVLGADTQSILLFSSSLTPTDALNEAWCPFDDPHLI